MLVLVLEQVNRECDTEARQFLKRSRPRDRDRKGHPLPLDNREGRVTAGESQNPQAGRPASDEMT